MIKQTRFQTTIYTSTGDEFQVFFPDFITMVNRINAWTGDPLVPLSLNGTDVNPSDIAAAVMQAPAESDEEATIHLTRPHKGIKVPGISDEDALDAIEAFGEAEGFVLMPNAMFLASSVEV